jgi:hypothetical protein
VPRGREKGFFVEIRIPKIVRLLALADYAEEYGEAAMEVWLNPPTSLYEQIEKMMRATDELVAELRKVAETDKARADEIRNEINASSAKVNGWLSEIWSQGAPETHMSVDDIMKLANETRENDPALFRWLVAQTWLMILKHRAGLKKN